MSTTDFFDSTLDDTPEPRAADVKPILVVTIGSSMAGLIPLAHRAWQEIDDRVPARFVAIDSLSYQDLRERLVSSRHTEAQIDASLPRDSYHPLANPFTEGFDFDNPLNRKWRDIMHAPELVRAATRPEGPGCAGTPALGRARAEYDASALTRFFEGHLRALTQVNTRNLALCEGVRVQVYTTFRGGTGCGAAEIVCSVLQEILEPGSEIDLMTGMPCVFRGDDRAHANALVSLKTIAKDHGFGERVPRPGGASWAPPLTTVRPVFVSDGAATLAPRDLLMQEVALLRGQLRAPTQSAWNARHVDLNDVFPHDLDNQPLHVRTATACTIRTVQPGTLEYLAGSTMERLVAMVAARFEAWLSRPELQPDEKDLVKRTVDRVCADLDLTTEGLLRRLSTEPSPENQLRQHLNQVSGQAAQLDETANKRAIQHLPGQLSAAFKQYEAGWESASLRLARKLPEELVEALSARLAAKPHLLIAALAEVRTRLNGEAETCAKQGKEFLRRRGAASAQLAEQMKAVAEARGWLLIVDADEATRDAALPAIATAGLACQARCEQHKREYLEQALRGELSLPDAQGQSVTLSSVVPALRARETALVLETNDALGRLKKLLTRRVETLGLGIEHRSAVFQRALFCDGLDRTRLDQRADRLVARFEQSERAIDFVAAFLKPGATDRSKTGSLDALFADLTRLLPDFHESQRTMTELFQSSQAKRQLIVDLLRGRRPFAPLDRVVLDQQGMRDRRDRLVLFELPGGSEGPIAAHLVRQGVLPAGAVPHNCIIDSGNDEIRFHDYREGLPYAALRPLLRYQDKTARYLAKPGSMSPYPWTTSRRLPELKASSRNVVSHVQGLIFEAEAAMQGAVMHPPSGGVELAYDEDRGGGFMVPKTERFQDLAGVVRFLASHVGVRTRIEEELAQRMDADPASYRQKLLDAWHTADGDRRHHLERALFHRFATNPYKLTAQVS